MEHEWYNLSRLRARKQLRGMELIPVKAYG